MGMHGFVGRDRELAMLDRELDKVRRGGRAGRPGRALLMRGRRRIGKSRLAEEFVERAGVPHVFFTASGQPSTEADLDLFTEAAASSDLPGAEVFRDQTPASWDAALRLLAAALPEDRPSVVILDEMPYLIANDSGFEGTLQKQFDRALSRRRVLLICIGSDLAMMEALNEYGRPFHQRATEMVIPPLNPADVATMLDLTSAEAFDAYLVTGGLPLILDEWPHGAPVADYLNTAVADPTSALLVSAERALAAEFPTEAQARRDRRLLDTHHRPRDRPRRRGPRTGRETNHHGRLHQMVGSAPIRHTRPHPTAHPPVPATGRRRHDPATGRLSRRNHRGRHPAVGSRRPDHRLGADMTHGKPPD